MNKELESLEAVHTHTHTHTHTGSLKEKGVTLVALVVTIVVLLILAGVTINLVVGQNGLISKAKEAANATNKVGLKEKIDMALTDYEIERLTNSNITFKEYVENNKEQIGIGDFKIIDENPSEDVQFIGSLDGKIIVMKTDGSYVLTKSENLVKNGFGDNGTENFSDFFNFENHNRTFKITNSQRYGATCNEFIKIDNTKKYYQSIIANTDNVITDYFMGIIEYDVDRKVINNIYQKYVEGSLTYLERNLNDGDTEIYLNDIDGFIKNDIATDCSGIIVWNYKDSTGYEYPELTYSRNVYMNLFDDENDFDIVNKKIILKEPWSYGKIEKGTELSQCYDGSSFNYGVIDGKITNENKMYENIISGIKDTGQYTKDKFCYATKYVRVWMGFNYLDVPNVTTEIKDIIFAECE